MALLGLACACYVVPMATYKLSWSKDFLSLAVHLHAHRASPMPHSIPQPLLILSHLPAAALPTPVPCRPSFLPWAWEVSPPFCFPLWKKASATDTASALGTNACPLAAPWKDGGWGPEQSHEDSQSSVSLLFYPPP